MVEAEMKNGVFRMSRSFRIEDGDKFIVAKTDGYLLAISCHGNTITVNTGIFDEELVAKAIIESDTWITRCTGNE